MIYLYSKENFEEYLLDTEGVNGEILETLSINRPNRNTDIYVKFTTTGRILPRLYRGYYDDENKLKYHSLVFPILDSSINEFVFEYDMFNDFNYVCYRFEFECLEDVTLNISEIGVIFDDIESTLENSYNIGTIILSDINQNPLSKQVYDEVLSFSLITNRTNLGSVLNIIEKPYYLVDIKDGCINNSSNELIENGISSQYITGATKYLKININNIVR